MAQTPMINGERHSWGDIKANIMGRTPTGITAISYEEKQEKKNHYGAGNMPVHRGRGNYEASAKITLYGYEVEAIQRAAGPGKRLVDIPSFDITVSYLNPNDQIVTHVLRNCEFTGNKRDLKQGDTTVEVELELIVSHIEWS